MSMVVVELCRPNFLNSTFVLQSFTQLFFCHHQKAFVVNVVARHKDGKRPFRKPVG